MKPQKTKKQCFEGAFKITHQFLTLRKSIQQLFFLISSLTYR